MSAPVMVRTFALPPFDGAEALRYARCPVPTDEVKALLADCRRELEGQLTPRVCWCETDTAALFALTNASADLRRHLAGCSRAVVFAATMGLAPDRLITRYGQLSPARALMLQAIGTERVEALCDVFCAGLAADRPAGVTARFSPGYGDLPLDTQRDIFALLDPPRHIGVTLNQSLLMSPSKSVTAIVGMRDDA